MTIRVGIIGLSASDAAWTSVTHGKPLKEELSSKYQLTAVVTSSEESAAASAKRWGVSAEKAYTSAESIATDPDVDLVVVGVKLPLHKELALPALKAGKDVFVEWPLGTNMQEVQELQAAAKKGGGRAIVGLQARCSPTILKAREIIESGKLGRIVGSTVVGWDNQLLYLPPRYDYEHDAKNRADISTITSGHVLDSVCYLLGELKSLSCTTNCRFPEIETPHHSGPISRNSPDAFMIQGTFKTGASLSFSMMLTTPGTPSSITWIISGEKGALKFEGENINIQIQPPKLSMHTASNPKWQEVTVPPPLAFGQVANLYQALAVGEPAPGSIVDFDGAALRHRYRIQSKEFFKTGRVFSILWHENQNLEGTLISRTSAGDGKFEEQIFSGVRHMVVAKEGNQCARCLPVTTYSGLGVAKLGVDPSNHAIVYMTGTAPLCSVNEPDMTKEPLEIDPSTAGQWLDPMSRLNFGKAYIVEHNTRVLPVGTISPMSMARFENYANAELSLDGRPPVLALDPSEIKSLMDILGPSDISSQKDSDTLHKAVYRMERSKLQGEPTDSDESKTKGRQTELDKLKRHLGSYERHADWSLNTLTETDDQLLFQVYQTSPNRDEQYRDALLHFFACTLCQKGGIDPQTMHPLEYSKGRKSSYNLFKIFTDEIMKEKKGLRFTSLSIGQSIIVDHIIKLINEHQDDIFNLLPSKFKVTRGTDELAEHLTHLLHQQPIQQVYDRQKLTFITPFHKRLEINHFFALQWLVDLHQFETLATRIQRACHGVDELKALEIQHQIQSLLPFDVLNDNKRNLICFELEWDLLGILKTQYDGALPRLGSVLVLTGSALYAQATTCRDYIIRTWPETGKVLLAALEEFMEQVQITKTRTHSTRTAHFLDNGMGLLVYMIHKDDDHNDEIKGKLIINTSGAPQVLIETAQQHAWLVAAVNLPPDKETIVHAETSISKTTSNGRVSMQVEFQTPKSSETACWLPLFHGATIAKGFPIMERGYERGLEITLSIFMLLLCAQHAVEYRGSVIIKGFSAMLVPVQFIDDRVQWHLICSADPEENLQYQEGLARCPTRRSLDEFGLEHLSKTRAIVGWCTSVTCSLGSKEANYHNLDYSKARDISQSLNITGGTLGIQQIGVAQVDFALGCRHGRHHLQRAGPYRRIVALAEKTYVALYDTGENRGWLIPASNVMLHIAHHRHHLDPFSVGEKRVELGTVGEKEGFSAKDVLLQNEKTKLMDDNGESYLFRDMIMNIWSIMEYLIAQQIEGVRSRGLRPREMVSDVLYGFEFKAITEERSPFRVKQTPVQHTSGGWPTLIRDIDALVLFASGYENVLLPALGTNEKLCHEWRTVPKGKDYLATAITTLKDIYDAAGCRLDRTYLTSTLLQWHRGNSLLWEPCQQKHSSYCNCKRVQQIVSYKPGFTVIPPGRLIDDGAIIIGGPNSLQRRSQPVKHMQGIYGQPNVTLDSTGLQNGPKLTEEIDDHDKELSVDDDDDDDSDSYANSLSSIPASHSPQTPITSSNNSSANNSQDLSCRSCLDTGPLLQV